jgi:2-epi-5-epi-valiolone synthase
VVEERRSDGRRAGAVTGSGERMGAASYGLGPAVVPGVGGDAPLTFPMWCDHAREYVVRVGEDLPRLLDVVPDASVDGRRALAVTTPTVDRLHGAGFRGWLAATGMDAVVEVIALDEDRKTMETALEIVACAQRHDLGRRDVMIAFGGGVCSDVVSVAASLTRRGIAHITVPTTLVGQVDAGIGLKGGVNFGAHKNYLGCFSPPESALIVPGYLRSLPDRELRCGVAEIMKMALIRDRELFDVLRGSGPELIASAFASPPHIARYVLGRSIQLMLEELAPNTYEHRTLRRLVDFGHTFSSTLEERSAYRVKHGEAVAIDMALTCEIAARLGILDRLALEEAVDAFAALGLPRWSPLCTPDAAAHAIDVTVAHRGGRLNLAVPEAIGAGTFVEDARDVPPSVIASAIDAIASRAGDRSD